MKKLLMIVACVASFALTSCSEPFDDSAIWDQLDEYGESIRDHEQRISALEELCKQMNTNISSLQTIVAALQNNDYVTAIVPVIKDGITIGYTITFTKSQPITIYHGEDGKDGANGQDGKDGYTPQIGVKQDTDSIYYWTLDGEWLLDASGNKIKAVGTDGKDGQDGKDGADGITPQLKIEDGYWYISYDNGTTWTQLGKATGENGQNGQNGQNGADGKDGQDGDSFFQSVTQDDDFVYFTLADGTVITLPKYKEEAVNENCKIYYTTSDGKKMFPKTDASLYGAILISNTYKDGQGVLTFDDAVTSIGYEAFYKCTSLTSIAIPDSVTEIGYRAFQDCTSLTSFTIPDSVTLIGGDAFYGCTSLKAFYGKYASEDNHCWIPNGVLTFFAPAELTEYTIPNSVTSIVSRAFYNCTSLTSITIPDSVTKIEKEAFLGCTGELTVNCNIPSASQDSDGAFYGSQFTKVTIGNSVTEIGGYAFYGCEGLRSVTIGNSVTKIEKEAFYGCTGELTVNCNIPSASQGRDGAFCGSRFIGVTIGNSVTEIGGCAFYGCDWLSSVTIGNSVTSIGGGAFYYCHSLRSVTIPDSITSIGGSAFYYCNSLKSITIGNSVTEIGGSAFAGCYDLESVTIPDSVTSIGGYAFAGCEGLRSVTIGNSVTEIGKYAFAECYSLTRVNITDLSAWCKISFSDTTAHPCFYRGYHNDRTELYLNGSELTDITIPSDITEIKAYAFIGCTSLTSVTIPDSVTSIGNYAFQNCTSLTSVTIPDSVTSIGDYTFAGCYDLESVTIPDSVTEMGYRSFDECHSLKDVYVNITDLAAYATKNPMSAIGENKHLLVNGVEITELVIPNSVTSIGDSTFRSCTSLTSVTIPDSVTTIGDWAFDSCTSLTSVTIPDSVTEIGKYAFYYCTSLKEVYCKPTTPPIGGSDMFYYNVSGRKIYVPTASVEAYKAASYWKDYASYIVGYDF